MSLPPDKTPSLNPSSSQEDDLYNLSFSHTGFEEALLQMDVPYQPSGNESTTTRNNSIGTSHQRPRRHSQIRANQPNMSVPKQHQRTYSSGSLSSTISSFSLDEEEFPMSIAINADIENFGTEKDVENDFTDHVKDEAHEEEIEPEVDPDLESTLRPQPQPSQESSFYDPPREGPVKINIPRGAFWAARSAATSNTAPSTTLSRTKLPLKGLSRGLPLAVSQKAKHKHGHAHLPFQLSNTSPRKLKGLERTHERLEEDMNETMMGIEKMGEGESLGSYHSGHGHRDEDSPDGDVNDVDVTLKEESKMNRLSVDLSMVENDRHNAIKLASPHLHEVYRRVGEREKIPENAREKKATSVEPSRLASAKSESSKETSIKERAVVVRPPSYIATMMEAADSGLLFRDPTKKQNPQLLPSAIPSSENDRQPPGTPRRKFKDTTNLSILHMALHRKQSPTKRSIIPPSPSRAARDLWHTAKTIHKNLSSMNIEKQRLELRALRDAANMPVKDLRGLSDWQVDAEYRTILKGLEKKWLVTRRSLKESISAWVEETKRECSEEGSGVEKQVENGGEVVVTDDEYETEDESEVASIERAKLEPKKNAFRRTESGRACLPVIPSYDAPQSPQARKASEPKARVHLPTIPTYDAPQTSNGKPRVHLPYIAAYDAPQSSSAKPRVQLPFIPAYNAPLTPKSKAREDRALRNRTPSPTKPAPAVASGVPVLIPGFVTPRRNRIALRPSPIREAREVWSEARKRYRNLSSLPIAHQRLELGAMRAAAGFADKDTKHVDDDKIVEVYRSEMRFLERVWMSRGGRLEGDEGASSVGEASRNWEFLGKSSGEERVGEVEVDDDEDSEFATTMGSSPGTPTPIRKIDRRPSRF